MTIYKEHTRISLVEGGNVFKQGDHVTLGFVPRDYAGNILDLTGKQIEGVVYSGRKGIMFQAPATFDSAEQKIVFTIDQVVDYGQFQIEFTATDASDPEYRLKLPSAEQDGRLTIKPSVDNMDFVGVQMTTVTQLRQEQTALQTEYEAKVDPKIAAVEDKAAALEQTVQQGIGAFTEDTEVLLARGGEVNLGARLDKTAAQLAETGQKTNSLNSEKTFFFAHRGMENLAPENTLIALDYAGQFGMEGVEFDIQDTSDGHWVLMHDDTVDRTTNGTGTIGSMTLDQVKALNIDAGPFISRYEGTKVPTLEDALLTCKKWGMRALIEIKKTTNDSNRIKIIEMIRRLNMIDSAIIIAPISTCIALKAIEPKIEYGGFLNNFTELSTANPLLPYAHISMEKNAITKEGVQLAHEQGFKVSAWTLNYDDGDIVQRLKSFGVDYITGTVLI